MAEEKKYLTVKQAQEICQYKWPDQIRRLVYSGELPATRLRGNRMLIPESAFWKWFHSFDIKVKKAQVVDGAPPQPLSKPEEAT